MLTVKGNCVSIEVSTVGDLGENFRLDTSGRRSLRRMLGVPSLSV